MREDRPAKISWGKVLSNEGQKAQIEAFGQVWEAPVIGGTLHAGDKAAMAFTLPGSKRMALAIYAGQDPGVKRHKRRAARPRGRGLWPQIQGEHGMGYTSSRRGDPFEWNNVFTQNAYIAIANPPLTNLYPAYGYVFWESPAPNSVAYIAMAHGVDDSGDTRLIVQVRELDVPASNVMIDLGILPVASVAGFQPESAGPGFGIIPYNISLIYSPKIDRLVIMGQLNIFETGRKIWVINPYTQAIHVNQFDKPLILGSVGGNLAIRAAWPETDNGTDPLAAWNQEIVLYSIANSDAVSELRRIQVANLNTANQIFASEPLASSDIYASPAYDNEKDSFYVWVGSRQLQDGVVPQKTRFGIGQDGELCFGIINWVFSPQVYPTKFYQYYDYFSISIWRIGANSQTEVFSDQFNQSDVTIIQDSLDKWAQDNPLPQYGGAVPFGDAISQVAQSVCAHGWPPDGDHVEVDSGWLFGNDGAIGVLFVTPIFVNHLFGENPEFDSYFVPCPCFDRNNNEIPDHWINGSGNREQSANIWTWAPQGNGLRHIQPGAIHAQRNLKLFIYQKPLYELHGNADIYEAHYAQPNDLAHRQARAVAACALDPFPEGDHYFPPVYEFSRRPSVRRIYTTRMVLLDANDGILFNVDITDYFSGFRERTNLVPSYYNYPNPRPIAEQHYQYVVIGGGPSETGEGIADLCDARDTMADPLVCTENRPVLRIYDTAGDRQYTGEVTPWDGSTWYEHSVDGIIEGFSTFSADFGRRIPQMWHGVNIAGEIWIDVLYRYKLRDPDHIDGAGAVIANGYTVGAAISRLTRFKFGADLSTPLSVDMYEFPDVIETLAYVDNRVFLNTFNGDVYELQV